MCKFRFWLVHWIDPRSIEHSYACLVTISLHCFVQAYETGNRYHLLHSVTLLCVPLTGKPRLVCTSHLLHCYITDCIVHLFQLLAVQLRWIGLLHICTCNRALMHFSFVSFHFAVDYVNTAVGENQILPFQFYFFQIL